MLDISVQQSRAIRLERQKSRFRDRGGIFVPSNRNTLIDILLARSVTGESPEKKKQAKKPARDKGKGKPNIVSESTSGHKDNVQPIDTSRPPRSRSSTVQESPLRLSRTLKPASSGGRSLPEKPKSTTKVHDNPPPETAVVKRRGRPPKSKSNPPPSKTNTDASNSHSTSKPNPKRKPKDLPPTKKNLVILDSDGDDEDEEVDDLPDTPTQKRPKTAAMLTSIRNKPPSIKSRPLSTVPEEDEDDAGASNVRGVAGDATTIKSRSTAESKSNHVKRPSAKLHIDVSDNDSKPEPPKPVRRQRTQPARVRAKVDYTETGDEEVEAEDSRTSATSKKRGGRAKAGASQDVLDEPSIQKGKRKREPEGHPERDCSELVGTTQKSTSNRVVQKRPRIVPKNLPSDIEEEDEDEDEDGGAVKTKPIDVVKTKPSAPASKKRRRALDVGSNEDAQSDKRKRIKVDVPRDDEGDESDGAEVKLPPPKPKPAKKRARKPVPPEPSAVESGEKKTTVVAKKANCKENAVPPRSKPEKEGKNGAVKVSTKKISRSIKPASRRGPPKSVLNRIRNASPMVVDSDADPIDFLS